MLLLVVYCSLQTINWRSSRTVFSIQYGTIQRHTVVVVGGEPNLDFAAATTPNTTRELLLLIRVSSEEGGVDRRRRQIFSRQAKHRCRKAVRRSHLSKNSGFFAPRFATKNHPSTHTQVSTVSLTVAMTLSNMKLRWSKRQHPPHCI